MQRLSTSAWRTLNDWFKAPEVQAIQGDPGLLPVALECFANNICFHSADSKSLPTDQYLQHGQLSIRDQMRSLASELRGDGPIVSAVATPEFVDVEEDQHGS